MQQIILETKNLNVRYGKNQILNNINVSFQKNKITAIIGSSGCGKSTLLKSFNRTIEEDGGQIDGEIIFEGSSIFDMPQQLLRSKIGMVFQSPVVFPTSIYKNMTFAPIYYGIKNKEELDKIVKENLEKAGLYDEVKENMSMLATKLSGGQKQRLVIARSLTVNPKIILLDEPCSSLDMKNTNNIEKMLINLKCEYTIIIVTHNLAQAKRVADKVIFVDCGNIVEVGTTDEIFLNPKDKRTKEYITYMGN